MLMLDHYVILKRDKDWPIFVNTCSLWEQRSKICYNKKDIHKKANTRITLVKTQDRRMHSHPS